jgi:hypothetical protein
VIHFLLLINRGEFIRLAQFHPSKFYTAYLLPLENQVENYIVDMRSNEEFFWTKIYWQSCRKVSKDEEEYCITVS